MAAQKRYVKVVKSLLAGNTEPQQLLIEAAQNGEEAVVATLLETGISPDDYGNSDWLALHYAAEEGHLNVVQLLVSAGANLDITTDQGLTPLHIAAQRGHTAVVAFLADPVHAADINKLDNRGQTPLILACDNGHHQVVALLISAGAKKDVGTFLTTDASKKYINNPGPWLVAARKRHVEVVKLLLAGNTEPQYLLIEKAAQNGEEAVVTTLLETGISPDDYGNSDWLALHYGGRRRSSQRGTTISSCRSGP